MHQRIRWTRTGAGLLLALVVVGCANADAKDPPPAAATTTTTASVTTPEAIATNLRKLGFEVGELTPTQTGTGLVAREAVETVIDGVSAAIYTFGNTQGTQIWAEQAKTFGGIAVVGDTWAIALYSDEDGGTLNATSTATVLADQTGGTVL
jgi:hypothetical protein